MFDIGNVISKLKEAGLVREHETGMSGEFSIKRDSHLLTPTELKFWLDALHAAGTQHDEQCTDLHRWNFEETN